MTLGTDLSLPLIGSTFSNRRHWITSLLRAECDNAVTNGQLLTTTGGVVVRNRLNSLVGGTGIEPVTPAV